MIKYKILKAITHDRKTLPPGGEVTLDPKSKSTDSLLKTGFISSDLGEPAKSPSTPPPPLGGADPGADDGKGKGKGK